MAKADLILDYREQLQDGSIVTVKIWLVPRPVVGSTHPFKYSLFFGRPGVRMVGYDNERGKGDHRHCGDSQETYEFVSVEQLMADFGADTARGRGGLW
jgi:Family of unknown function (DUF6516)